MIFRKAARKYYFSVEGETEKWYLEWLAKMINLQDKSQYKASIISKIEKDPLSMAKGLTITDKTAVTHLCDYESDSQEHNANFTRVMDRMAAVSSLGKQIKYSFGYSNFTFELWIILHKTDCRTSFSDRKQYLLPINNAFNEAFQNLSEYKEEKNFKRILASLKLDDVVSAIERSKAIMRENAKIHQYRECTYKKFRYYKENPSLMIWESVEQILNDCGC